MGNDECQGSESPPSEQTDPTDFAKKVFKVIKNNQQQLAAIQQLLDQCMNNRNWNNQCDNEIIMPWSCVYILNL